ncbi:MAG: helicase associated domain-containing protein [Prosthecobacter sp.]|nr:helicase associated domain-containing protein [Prosthecobacter sp.]
MLHQLVCYSIQHGHCHVPSRDRRHPKLSGWLEQQVELFRKGRLPQGKQKELEALGMKWDAIDDQPARKNHNEDRWEARFVEIVAFQRKHGHLRITLKNQLSPGLVHWRDNQRIRFESGVLTTEQKTKLDSIGFEWEPPKRISPAMEKHNVELWESMFAKLLVFREEHGHCQVPKSRKYDATLAAWVRAQRNHHSKNKLLPERQRRLEEIGFAWKSDKLHFVGGWGTRFSELVAFKEKHGHLRITKKNQLSAGLMHWRDNQRIRFRSGVMPPEQKARLDALGFEWENPERLSPSMEEHNVALWESMFTKLLAFREAHGHCQVPQSKKSDALLGKWVQRQRYHHRKNTLLPERRQRLEEIGFVWQSDKLHFADGWEGRFAELVAFQQKHSHLRVTKTNELSPGLSHWRDNQRIRLRNGAMKPEQKAKLDALGFEWDPPGLHTVALVEHQESQWESKFAQLAAFKEAQGHTRVSKNWRGNPALGQWLQKQRSKFRKGSGVGGLLPERLSRLDALGTEWREYQSLSPFQARPAVPQDPRPQWEQRYARLVEFHRLNGHANVPGHPDRLLRKWVLEQRAKHAEASLEADQIARLEALGFSWQTPNLRPVSPLVPRERSPSIWELRFEELAGFVSAHGHFRVPKNKEEFKKLRHWVVAQRVYHRQGSLSSAHREKLDKLGFPWEPGQSGRSGAQGGCSLNWEDHLRNLAVFKEQHGHTRVLHHRGPDMKLGGWLVRQRALHREGRLPQDRFQKMDEIGVDWNPANGTRARHQSTSRSSDERMAELREFHARHGHANVPTKYPPNRLLGNWVSNTRIRKGQLSESRIRELESLGFLWRGERNNAPILAITWGENFAKLLEFHRAHGHANVRSTDPDHHALAAWVASQRMKHRRGTLQADRVQKLESIGLKWGKAEYQAGLLRSWDQRFDELVAFRRQHGHPHVSKADKSHHSLDIWAKTQRMYYHQGKLSADQIKRLESIGFSWNGKEGWWERQFRRWEAATQRRRTRHLTAIGEADDDLAKWEQTQRNLHRLGKLSAVKASKLTRAGLIFAERPPEKSRLQMPHQKLHAQT